MFNPTLLPPAPEGPPVPDGSQSGEVRQTVPVNCYCSYHHALNHDAWHLNSQRVQFARLYECKLMSESVWKNMMMHARQLKLFAP